MNRGELTTADAIFETASEWVLTQKGQMMIDPQPDLGTDEGDTCNRLGCDGMMGFEPVENCSCHLYPPCGQCTSNPLVCGICGYGPDNEMEEPSHE